MQDFYREVVERLLRDRVLDLDMRVLVLCGGKTDQAVLQQCGLRNVVISNVAESAEGAFAPYEWSHQDAEQLTYPDESFDFCIVHSGLHHCRSPHRALVEMYRVARKGLLLFEPYDNLVTRIGVKLKIGQEYEHASVYFNHGDHGGVNNSPIPNYVYRFTEHEIIKTIQAYAPYAKHDIRFIHAMRIPWGQLRARRNKTLYRLVWIGRPALKLIEACFPKQTNNFAAVVLKPRLPESLHPWLRQDGGEIVPNEAWMAAQYGK